MTVLPIITAPNPRLTRRSAEALPGALMTPAIRELVQDMRQTMAATDGIGLAAPQVGHSIRIIIASIFTDRELMALANPVVLEAEGTRTEQEGCLSIPGDPRPMFRVPRATKAMVEAIDLDLGGSVHLIVEGLPARVLQHEIDHLDGILCRDKTTP